MGRGPRLTDWSFLPGRRNRRRNRRRSRNLQKKINYTDEGDVLVPVEINRKKTGLRWKQKRPRSLKYVDDNMMMTKVCIDSAVHGLLRDGRQKKDKHDVQTQNLFRRVVAKAESRGMVVNNKKTKVLCVSDVQTYKATAHLFDADGNRIESGAHLKVLRRVS